MDEQGEAQRGDGTCPRPHSKLEAEIGQEPAFPVVLCWAATVPRTLSQWPSASRAQCPHLGRGFSTQVSKTQVKPKWGKWPESNALLDGQPSPLGLKRGLFGEKQEGGQGRAQEGRRVSREPSELGHLEVRREGTPAWGAARGPGWEEGPRVPGSRL